MRRRSDGEEWYETSAAFANDGEPCALRTSGNGLLIDRSTLFAVVPYENQTFSQGWFALSLSIGIAFLLLLALWVLARFPRTRPVSLAIIRFPWAHPWATLLGLLIAAVAGQVAWERYQAAANSGEEASFFGKSSTTSAPRTLGVDWPCDRGSLLRTGRVADSAGPRGGPIVRLWRMGRPDESFHSSPAVVGNRVYAVGSEQGKGRVVAVDLATGQLAWSGGPRDLRATFSSPVVLGDMLVCGEGLHTTRQARVFSLDLAPHSEGKMLWSFRTEGHVECSPQVENHRIYFNAGDDGTYALEPPSEPGAPPSVAYHGVGARFVDAETALLVTRERAYVGLGVQGNALCMLDAKTGEELRRVATDDPVFALPALVDDALFIGTGEGDYADPARASRGAVWRLDSETLDVVWRREVPGTVLGAILVADSHVVFGCGDGRVYRVSLDNASMASWDTGAPIAAPLAVADTWIYGVNHAGKLFAIDSDTDRIAWRHSLGAEGHYVSGPVVVGETLVLGTPHDGLVCYGRFLGSGRIPPVRSN